MTTGSVPDPAAGPRVALRLVTTHDDVTRRVDVVLQGRTSALLEDGEQTLFSTERLWPVLRDLLPPLELLREPPHGTLDHRPRLPGPGFVQACRAHVSIATLVGTGSGGERADEAEMSVRTWLVTDDDLWAVEPRPDGSSRVRTAPPGALADHVLWDVTAAMEALVRTVEAAS